MSRHVHIARLKSFMIHLGTAARNLPQIEKEKAYERKLVKEFFKPAIAAEIKQEKKEERKANVPKADIRKEIKELKETIIKLAEMFKQIEKEAGNRNSAHKIKFRLDLLHHRLMVLEKKKSK